MKIPLVDICDFQGGTQPPKDEWIDHEEPGYIRMLQIRDFTQSEKNNIEYVKDTSNLKKCTPDDILIGRYGASVGTILTGLSGAYNVAIVKTVPNKEKVCPQFLFHYFNAPYFQNHISSVGSRAAQAGFNKDDLGKLYFPLLPLDEQRRIAAVLDKVSDLIAKRREQLDKLDELVKARFVEMFGDPEFNLRNWPIVSISDVCTVGSSKRIYQSEQTFDGVPFLRISDLNHLIDTGDFCPSLFISEEKYQELQQRGQVPIEGDILVTSRGTLGRCYIIKTTDRFYFQDGMISWISNLSNEITSLFIAYLFDMQSIKRQIESMQAGSTVSYLSIDMIKRLKIMLPDRNLQKQFGAFVDQTNKSKLTIQQSLDKLEVLKKALMQQYFG